MSDYEYLISQGADAMSEFDGYPGHGGFYQPNPNSAKSQAAKPEPAENEHLKMARAHMEEYTRRINADTRFSDILDRQVYEDRAYHLCMMHAAYAQAEAATRQAEVMESLLEFASEVIARTDLIDGLMQWSCQQRAR
jgi:hypothetical protein